MATSGDITTNYEDPPSKKGLFSFFRTKRFWLVLFIGQILALCITGSTTFSGLLVRLGTSIPAFQNIFVYILLNLVYTSYTLYVYGLRNYVQMLQRDGWKYFILAFLDVEGNYFVVLAYRYTTVLSAQLINFWAIVVVVIISFSILKVRYHWAQILGILVACGGMGLLMASDHIHRGSTIGGAPNELKGDLFMLLGATFYGFSNVTEEFLVSKRPLYEVVGQIGFWGIFINGVQAAIFDREQFKNAVWDRRVGGYIIGFTLCLFTFYTIAPILFRMASAAFFNISLLTANFWVLLIGLVVFRDTIMWLYGVAFTCIVVGLVIYYILTDMLGESKKPWLGENQEEGVEGVGTAKREISKKVQESEA
ncbi:solute carrier family 35 member SLC35F1/F2/F6 [Tirmania nivea]|nr:solute carrier family 35 member SLC35F1/F2/F6 [Tirmania nivea]